MSLLAVNAVRVMGRRTFSMAAPALSGNDTGSGLKEFDKIEAANENAYFKKLEAQQFEKLRQKHDAEIQAHEKQIQAHLVSYSDYLYLKV
jgi:hypothetical protein